MTKADRPLLSDVLDAVAHIRKYVQGQSREDFMTNELVRDAVIRQVQIIGEATRLVSPGLKSRYSQVPWQEIVGLRNRVIHAYGTIMPEIIWEIVENDLEPLRKNIERILADLDG